MPKITLASDSSTKEIAESINELTSSIVGAVTDRYDEDTTLLEVKQLRIVDGKRYSSAGQAIKYKFNELQDNIDSKPDFEDLVNGTMFKGSDTTINITCKEDAINGDKWYSTDEKVYYVYSSRGWINCGNGENLNKLENTIKEINERIDNFNNVEVDESLSMKGTAADAAATGDALKNISKYITFATAAQAKLGEDDTTIMTPYKTALAIQELASGSGGSSGVTIPTMTSSFEGGSFALNEDIEIRYKWGSPNNGNGTLHVTSDSIEIDTQTVAQGLNRYVVSGLTKGTHSITMYVIDKDNQYTDTLKFIIKVGTLDIISVFNDSSDFGVTQIIKVPITVDTISLEPIYMVRTIDDEQITLEASQGYNIYQLPTLKPGAHKVTFQANSSVYVSNIISFNVVIEDTDNLTLLSDFSQDNITYRSLLEIPYRVSLKGVNKFNAFYYIDNVLIKELVIPIGTNIWSTRDLSLGTHDLKIVVKTQDASMTSSISFTVMVNASTYTPLTPVIDSSLLAWFDASGKTNNDIDKEIWKDKSSYNTTIDFYNVNYGTNGWIDGALKLNSGSYGVINLTPLHENCPYGITVDIKFRTRDIGSQDACVMDMRNSDSNNKGFAVDTMNMYLNSSATKIKSSIIEEEISRATFVVDRPNNIAKIYNNGVQTEAFLISDTEDFSSDMKIYLNTKLELVDGAWQPSLFGDCEIYSIRVYDRPLDSSEVIQNLISDINDLTEQEEKYNINYKNNMPTMYFYGNTAPMTKDTKVPLRIKYISPDSTLYGESFDLSDCPVGWQGTSSLQYVIKNYKIKLTNQDGSKYKWNISPNSIAESTFCLKADYMESSHANNTGMAKFINDKLYEEKTPPQQLNDKVRTTITGFPIQLYIAKDSVSTPVYMGIYNFNLDKSDSKSFGMDNEQEGFENCCCFEVSANSGVSAGAFKADDLTTIRSDFEIVYPDEDDITSDQLTGYYTNLQKLISWVKNSTEETFKAELEQHFNKEFLIKYFLQVYTCGMCDNFGKNMFLRTWDGNIWYPTFYDLDSQLGLDNTGYLKFQSDIEIVEGVYNTSGSRLFTMLQTCFIDEITETYKKLRMNGIYTIDSIMSYWYDQQVKVIGENQYNIDMETKYIAYKNDYLFMMHGRRYEHLKKWLTERILYLDTVYGYEEDTSASITIRANKSGGVYIDILTYSPQYLTVKWRSGDGGTQRLRCNRDSSGNMISTRFNGTLTTSTDQEIIIYNAKQIKRINGLKNLNPSVLNLVEASKITEIDCQDCTLLTDVRVSSKNTFVGKVNFLGCTNLGTATGGGNTLDLSAMTNLSLLNVGRTSLEVVNLPLNGCNLETIYFPATIKNIDIENMPLLQNIWCISATSTSANYYNPIKANIIKIINCPQLKLSTFKVDTENQYYLNSYTTKLILVGETIEIENSLVDDITTNHNFFIGSSSTDGRSVVDVTLTSLKIKDVNFGNTNVSFCFNSPCTNTPSVKELSLSNVTAKLLGLMRLAFIEKQDIDLSSCKIFNLKIKAYANVDTIKLSSTRLNGIYISEKEIGAFDHSGFSSTADSLTFPSSLKYGGVFDKTLQEGLKLNIAGIDCSTDVLDLFIFDMHNFCTFTDNLPFNKYILNCDFTKIETSVDFGFLQYDKLFNLPNRVEVEGKLVVTDRNNIWCTGRYSNYVTPPIENFEKLDMDISHITNLSGYFYGFSNLKSLDKLHGLLYAVNNAVSLSEFLRGTYNIESLGELEGADITNTNCLSASDVFYACGTTSPNVTLTLGNVNFPNTLTKATSIFGSSRFSKIGNVTIAGSEATSLFYWATKLVTVGNINCKNLRTGASMFYDCSLLENIGAITLSDATKTYASMFQGCDKLAQLPVDFIINDNSVLSTMISGTSIDINSFINKYRSAIETCTGADSLFSHNLVSTSVGDIHFRNTSNIILDNLFEYSEKIETVGSIIADGPCTATEMFKNNNSLKSIEKIDLALCTKATNIISGYYKLESINYLDLTTLTATSLSNYYLPSTCKHIIYHGTIHKAGFASIYYYYMAYDSETIESLINCLEDSDTAVTIKFIKSVYNTLTETQIATMASKGWTAVSYG